MLIFSIIVPTYNTDLKLFKNCLNSIKVNDLEKSKFEVIIINDGMKDFSKYNQIIKDTLTLSNIRNKVINNDINMKQGYGRYQGLKESKGDYVHFVDADDEVYPYTYTTLIKYLKDEPNFVLFKEKFIFDDVDVTQQNFIFNHITKGVNSDNLDNHLFSKKDMEKLRGSFIIPLHSKIFDRLWLLKNTKQWIPNLYLEDFVLMIEVLIKAEKFKVCLDKLYHYHYLNTESTMHMKDNKLFFDALIVYDKIFAMIYTANRWELRHLILDNFLAFYSLYSKEYMGSNFDYFFIEIMKKYKNMNFKFLHKKRYHWFKRDEKLKKLFSKYIFNDKELFFQQMMDVTDYETIIPHDKLEIGVNFIEYDLKFEDLIKTSDNGKQTHSNELYSGLDLETLFFSSILFTLAKFTYNKQILITKILTNSSLDCNKDKKYPVDDEGTVLKKGTVLKRIIFGHVIDTSLDCQSFQKQIRDQNLKLNEYKDYFFKYFKKYNDIKFSDFQFYYENDVENKNITEYISANSNDESNDRKSNFIVIVNEKKKVMKIVSNNCLYSDNLINLFVNSLSVVLENFIKCDNGNKILLKDISVSSKQRATNMPKFIEPDLLLINELFQNLVNKYKDKIALVDKDDNLSFDELNRKANRVANYLIKKGLNIEDKVILTLKKNVNLVIAIFGVIKSGGTFILLDSDYPTKTTSSIKEDTNARYVINQDNIDSFLKEENENNPILDLKPDNLLCISYTSGSTGKSKGVIATHKSAAYKLNVEEFNMITSDDVFLSMTQPAYSLFLADLFVFLFKGVSIVLTSYNDLQNIKRLNDLYEKSRFNVMTIIPSIFENMLENDLFSKLLKKMKVIIFGGEKLNKKLLEKIRKKNFHVELFNNYGMAEDFNYSNVNNISSNYFPIGKPVLNVVERITDVDGNILPQGIMGELYVGGHGISKGYWNNKHLTEEKYTKINNISFFKTGDLAVLDTNNNYNIIGRIDNEIKLRGQKINLDDIENNIPNDIGIKKAMPAVKSGVLYLYFTLGHNLNQNEVNKVKDKIKFHLQSILPQYMVPQEYIVLDEFPKTKTGKISIKKLPMHNVNYSNIVGPKNELQKEIFQFAQDIIGYDDFGIYDNLLTVGFTSLLILNLTTKIFQKYGFELDLKNYYTDFTIYDVSKEIEESLKIKPKSQSLDFYPISPQQRGYINDSRDNHLKNNVYSFLRFKDVVSVDNLKTVLKKVIGLNSVMRTYFVIKNNEIYQKMSDDVIDIPVYDSEEYINFDKAFDLFKYPLFDVGIISNNKETIVFFKIHHIITDFYSMDIFHNDFLNVYLGNDVSIKKFNYNDYCLEVENSEKENSDKASKYLKKKMEMQCLSNYMIPIQKISDKNSSKHYQILLDHYKLSDFVEKYNFSLDIIFLSSVVLALGKFFDSENIFLEYIFNGREKAQYSNTMGLFRRHIPLFFNLNPDISSFDYLRYVEHELNDAYKIGPNSLFEEFTLFFMKFNPPKIVYDFHRIANKPNEVFEVFGKDNSSNFTNELIITIHVYDAQHFSISTIYDEDYFSKADVENISNLIFLNLKSLLKNES